MQRMGTCSALALLSRTDQASGGSVGYVGASLLRAPGGWERGGRGGSLVTKADQSMIPRRNISVMLHTAHVLSC